jgi:peptidoglycan/xylan/chitin deacetylase (PgdA/CDA1 family)
VDGNQTDDRVDLAMGEQSLRIVTQGDGLPVFTRKSDISPALNFTDRLLKVWIKVNGTDNVSELRVTVTNDEFQTFADYWIAGDMSADASFLRENQWNVLTLSPSQSGFLGSPDISSVNSVQVRVVDNGLGSPVTVWLNSLSLVAKNGRAIVTFAFDDGYNSDYLRARPALDEYHFSGTSYIIASNVGAPGRLTLAQLKNLQELNGWDIASHSYSHSNLTLLSSSEIQNELSLSQQFLENNGLHSGSEHFAYPFGEFDNDDLKQLVPKYYKTARTDGGGVETLPPSDPYRLRVFVVDNSTSPAAVSERVQSAIINSDWLILVFHRIVAQGPVEGSEYLRADFEAIVDDVASRGVDVMTVSEVYESKYH